jgi:hypothetical protein
MRHVAPELSRPRSAITRVPVFVFFTFQSFSTETGIEELRSICMRRVLAGRGGYLESGNYAK